MRSAASKSCWEQSYTRDEWLDLLPTTGTLTQLPPDKLAVVLDEVGAAVDKIGGGFTMTYTTLAATAAFLTPKAQAGRSEFIRTPLWLRDEL